MATAVELLMRSPSHNDMDLPKSRHGNDGIPFLKSDLKIQEFHIQIFPGFSASGFSLEFFF